MRRLAVLSLMVLLLLSNTNTATAALVYGGGTETGSRFNPGAGAITYMNCFTGLPGSTLILDDVTVGIRRGPTSGFLTEVGINIYAAEMTFDGVNFGRGANHLIHSTTLAASASAGFVTQLVTTAPNLGTNLALETVSNPGFGGWWIGLEFTGPNSANINNGWRVVNAPTTGASINGIGIFNNAGSGIFQAFFAFGTPPGSMPSRMMVNVNAEVVPEPSSLLLTGSLGLVGLVYRRRKS